MSFSSSWNNFLPFSDKIKNQIVSVSYEFERCYSLSNYIKMKKRLLFASFILALATQVTSQFAVFPSSEDLGDFSLENNPDGEFLLEVDPSILPGQNDLFPEVTSIMSGEWHSTNTWECACIPDEQNSVTISANHSVSFNQDIEMFTLHVTEDAELIGASDLNIGVNGDLAFYGYTDLTGINLSFGGAETQTVFGNCYVEKLFFTSANQINLEGNLFISEEIWVGAATLNTNGALNLTYNEEGVGEIAPIFNGTINGSISVSSEIATTESGWISIASPVTDANIGDIVDDFVTTGFEGADYPSHSFTNVSYYVEESDEGSTDFADVESANDLMEIGRGYYVYALAGNYVFDATGSPNIGEVDIPVGFTNNNNPSADGLNLVGNPYAATVNWDSETGWNKNNLVGAVYVWDVSQKQFRTYLNGLGVNGGSAFIKPLESFWVMAEGDNPSLSVNESAKSLHTSHTQESLQNIFVTISDDSWSDDLVITTKSEATMMFEPTLDALKFYGDNSVPNISTLSSDNVKLAINSIPEFSEAQDVQMMLNIPTAGDFTLTFAGVNGYISNQCIGLEDLITGESYDLAVTSEIEFSSLAVEDEIRFVFHIGAPVRAEATGISCNGGGNGTIVTEGSGDGPWNYTWYDQGMNLLGESLDEVSEFTITDLYGGDYILEVENNDFCGSLTLDVNIYEPQEPLNVFEGVYDIACEEDGTGEILLNISGGVQPIDVQWDNDFVGANIEQLEAGDYTYTITDAAGCVRMETLIVEEAADVFVDFTAEQLITLDEFNQAEVTFVNLSEGTTIYEWNFGDGSPLNSEESPTHVFTQPGFFTVSMYASNGECDDYHQAVVTVQQYSGIEQLNFAEFISIISNGNNITINSQASHSQPAQVLIYDLLGKVINSEKGVLGSGSSIQLDLKEANTVYIVSVLNLTTNEKTVRKISRF